MRKNIVLAIIGIFMGSAVFAQHGAHSKAKSPEDKAAFMTKKWTNELSLSHNQSTQILPIYVRQYKHFIWIDSLYATKHNKKAMFHSRKSVLTQTDSAMRQVLTSDQYSRYYKIKSQNKPKRRW